MDLYQSLVTVNPVTLIAQICNLFIQLFFVKKFFLDKIKAILDQRREAADKQITDAEAAKAEAMAIARPEISFLASLMAFFFSISMSADALDLIWAAACWAWLMISSLRALAVRCALMSRSSALALDSAMFFS